MTGRQMDKLIRAGKPVHFINTYWGEQVIATPIFRERYLTHLRAPNGRIAIISTDELEVAPSQ